MSKKLTPKKAITVILLSPFFIIGGVAYIAWIPIQAGWEMGVDLMAWWTKEPQEEQP